MINSHDTINHMAALISDIKDDKLTPVFSFLDIETTGLSCLLNDKICEIAVLRGPVEEKMFEWETLINPKRPISQEASRVNNITYEMVENAPTFDKVAHELREMIANTVVVCHNAQFDLGFIAAELKCMGMEMPEIRVIDTLKIAREHFNFPSNSLNNLVKYLDTKTKVRHRAMADVFVTYEIFNFFLPILSKRGVEIQSLLNICK